MSAARALRTRRCWIFDLDGTLTLAAHDFDAIRAELGLPPGRPILEELARMPPRRAAPLHERLDALELELARQARPARGAHALLAALRGAGARLGILTRNTREAALLTLRAVGLLEFFETASVLGRAEAAPKPSPDGIAQLLERWAAEPAHAVTVGDYRFDIEAGRAAGTLTVQVDPGDPRRLHAAADVHVPDLEALQRLL